MGKTPRVFNEEFKKMAVELSYNRSTLVSAAEELGIDDTLLGKWRKDTRFNPHIPESLESNFPTEKGKYLEWENKLLKKVLREVAIELDQLKRSLGIISESQ